MTGICLFSGFLAGIAFSFFAKLLFERQRPPEAPKPKHDPQPTPTSEEQERLKKQLDEINRFRG